MQNLEPWFDRAHNIFLDWMVAGGTLGLVSYLALYFSLLYLVWRGSNGFSYTEKTILTGLVASYFFHNLFVFDHLFSYVLFFSLLAYVHSKSIPQLKPTKPSSASEKNYNVALPIVLVATVFVIYFVNIGPMKTNTNLLGALADLQRSTPRSVQASEHFKAAYYSSRLGRTEVVEHMIIRIKSILESEEMSTEQKNEFFIFAREVVLREANNFEDDARTQLLTGTFFSSVGQREEALNYFNRAKELMPGKPSIYVELANAYLANGDKAGAIESLRALADMSPQHREQVEDFIEAIQSGTLSN
jgi:tetratricopeptide (TPR) repeat protein